MLLLDDVRNFLNDSGDERVQDDNFHDDGIKLEREVSRPRAAAELLAAPPTVELPLTADEAESGSGRPGFLGDDSPPLSPPVAL